MMADDFIKRVKRDPITRMFTGMPAKYSASGNLVTFGDILQANSGARKSGACELDKFDKVLQNAK